MSSRAFGSLTREVCGHDNYEDDYGTMVKNNAHRFLCLVKYLSHGNNKPDWCVVVLAFSAHTNNMFDISAALSIGYVLPIRPSASRFIQTSLTSATLSRTLTCRYGTLG